MTTKTCKYFCPTPSWNASTGKHFGQNPVFQVRQIMKSGTSKKTFLYYSSESLDSTVILAAFDNNLNHHLTRAGLSPAFLQCSKVIYGIFIKTIPIMILWQRNQYLAESEPQNEPLAGVSDTKTTRIFAPKLAFSGPRLLVLGRFGAPNRRPQQGFLE